VAQFTIWLRRAHVTKFKPLLHHVCRKKNKGDEVPNKLEMNDLVSSAK